MWADVTRSAWINDQSQRNRIGDSGNVGWEVVLVLHRAWALSTGCAWNPIAVPEKKARHRGLFLLSVWIATEGEAAVYEELSPT